MVTNIYRTVVLLMLLISGLMSLAQKTDTIVHINGNVLLGEIKKLDNGVITFKMDGMGTIKFELDKVNTFSSTKYFQVVTKTGMQYYGSFDTSSMDRRVYLNLLNGSDLMQIDDIVELYPIKRSFWLRTSGMFSLGFNYSKGSGIASLNTTGKLDYRNRKSYTVLNWNENGTLQLDTITSNKSDISIYFQRVVINRWYLGINTEASSNSELGLDLRALMGFSIINYVIHSNNNMLYFSVGTSGNKEWAIDIATPLNNIEGLLGINYHFFKYTNPEIHISTSINTYPSFTTAGRWRINYILDAKVEVINDFHVGINFYYNYDSKPVSTGASTNDYGITSTLSYSFH